MTFRAISLAGPFAALKERLNLAGPVKAIALVMLAVSALVLGLTFYSGKVMDDNAIARQRALVDNALTSRLERGVGELRSVAWWDDAVLYSSGPGFDQQWLDQEIGSYMHESYNHDRLIILDERNRPVYVYGDGMALDSPILRRDLRATASIIAQARGGPEASPRIKSTAGPRELYETAQYNNRRFSRGFGAIVSIDGKPAIAMASLITPSFDTSLSPPKRRIVLTIINITPDVLKAIGKEVLMHDLSFAHRQEQRTGTFMLTSDAGQPLVELAWTPQRPGTELVKRILPFIIGALCVAGLLMGYLLFRLSRSTTALARREEQARFLADHDALTGLPNRRRLEQIYNEMMNASGSARNRLLIACVDLDRFKDINDTLGHHAGDQLIAAVAQRLRSHLEDTDTLARIGGDEFAVMRPLAWTSDEGGLSAVIAQCFFEPFEVQGHQIESNASTGIAFADNHDSFDQSIKRADIALYDAKANGRGRSSRFTAAMSHSLEKRHAIETDLRRAIAAEELELHYQPIVEAQTGVISSLEALVRWKSPTHGNVPPDVFVGIAEEAGMMASLGRFIIDRVFADAKRWPGLPTAINISPAQLRSATIVADLINAATRNKVPARQITIEITESVLMSNDDRTLRVLNRLKEEGFSLALDDFGTGYSSLAYLRDFPFDKLKIDRSFVKGLSVNDRALAIVEGVVNFGRILGREIVAEGIETEQEMQAMQQAGCTHLQGWLFSKALPSSHIEALTATFGRLSARREPAGDVAEIKAADVKVPTRRQRPAARGKR